jgi:hypothetical protein
MHVQLTHWTLDALLKYLEDKDDVPNLVASNLKICKARSYASKKVEPCACCTKPVGLYDVRWKGMYKGPVCSSCISDFAAYGCD